jgi:hypothetical protein
MEVLKQRMDTAVLQSQVVSPPAMVNDRQEYINTVLAKRRLNITYREDEVPDDQEECVNTVLAERGRDVK